MSNEPQKEQYPLSNVLFKDKAVPDFISREPIFVSQPVQIKKVFPSLGLSNFKEITAITKPLFDIKKENTFVTNLLRDIYTLCNGYHQSLIQVIDEWQFLMAGEEKEKLRDKIVELNNFAQCLIGLSAQLSPYTQDIYNIPRIEEGKISLKISADLLSTEGKLLFKKDVSLFKVYSKIITKLKDFGIKVQELDTLPTFKIFSKENVSCKDYSIIFSSDRQEGAWDLLTMSMRGIRSCQRWDGEHRQCVIGSIVSKFIGIIYITSGHDVDGLGAKMLKRCIVRYVIDSDTKKPAIILDKMYPDFDEDILKAFMDSISKKTSIPVYYGPKLGKLIRSFYLPYEEMRANFTEAKWSYQDINIKSKFDKELNSYVNQLECLRAEVDTFYDAFKVYLVKQIVDINSNKTEGFNDIKPILRDLQSSSLVKSIGALSKTLLQYNSVSIQNLEPSLRNFLFALINGLSSKKNPLKAYQPYILQHFYDVATDQYDQ